MRQQFPAGPLGFLGAARRKAGYHHGNLKETLLDAAEALMAERGATGLSLSELARMAGVSPAAIYRHYSDLAMLIGAVAKRGFEAFAIRLREANATSGSGVEGLASMGNAYLAFARERPGAYAAMFSSPVGNTDGEVAAAGSTAFNTLAEGLSGALNEQGIDSGASFSLAIKIWAMAHGIATLTGTGRLSPAIGTTPEAMLRDGVLALIAAAKG
jgi:AcrR family transcriptional regulator